MGSLQKKLKELHLKVCPFAEDNSCTSELCVIKNVLEELGVVAQKIRDIQFPYKTYDNRRRYSPRYIVVLLDKVLGLLVEEGDE